MTGAQFADRHGCAPDIASAIYADRFLREPWRIERGPRRRLVPPLPQPRIPFWYREPGVWLPLSCAIAFDNNVSGGSSASPLTISNFAVGASSPGIWVGITVDSGDNITSVQFNGVNMNQIKKQVAGTGAPFKYGYWLAGQSGTHNIVVSASSGTIYADVVSVQGVDQSNVADASGSNAASPTSSLNISLTVVAANCWIFSAGENDSAASFTWSGAVSSRQVNSAYGGIGIGDSNGTVATGSQTATIGGSNANLYGVAASFAPSGASIVVDWLPTLDNPGIGRKMSVVTYGNHPGRN